MEKILIFLLKNLSFLYENYNFKFVDSEVSSSFGGDAYLTLESENMQVRIVNDRDQLYLEFRSIKHDKPNDWHTSDIIYQMITNQIIGTSLLDSKVASLIKDKFATICESFYPENAEKSVSRFKILERERSKRMFG